MAFKLNAYQVKAHLEQNTPITVIEALPSKYFRKGHLPKAINLEHDSTDVEIKSALPNLDAEIIVYCASGPCMNSGILSDRLVRMGYINTVDFHDGKEGWIQAGYSLVQ